jgi:hypothetical protein
MGNSSTGIPFLDDLHQKWQDGAMSSEEALAEVLRWEDDIAVRTDDELDAAYTFRQEIEGGATIKNPYELEALLDSGVAQHIDGVIDELRDVSTSGKLNDGYNRVLQTVLREGGPRYAQQIRQMLQSSAGLGPLLQKTFDDLGGPAQASPNPVGGAPKGSHAGLEDAEELAADAAHAGGNGAGPDPGLSGQGAAAPSFTSTHGMEDPWVSVQNYMALGRWDEARRVVSQITADHPRFPEVYGLLNAISEGETYDQVHGLGAMPGMLASSRSRRNWVEFNKRREQAEKMIADTSARTSRQIQMPRSLNAIFEEAVKAQDAEELVASAIQQRMEGDFAGAATSLADALTLDPRFARVQDEQQRNADLRDMLFDLRRNPLNTATELAEGLLLCEQLLEPNAAPGSQEVANRRDAIQGKISKLIENDFRRIEGRKRSINEPGNLEDKLQACESIDKQLEDVWLLRRDDPDLHDLQDWLDKIKRRLTELKVERGEVARFVAALDVNSRIDAAATENGIRRLDDLANEPLAQGDTETRTVAHNLVSKLSTYLDGISQPGKTMDLPTLENYAEILRLAQHIPRGLTPQQVTAYSRSIWSTGATLVRNLLPRSLPPYQPPQPGQAVVPRSGEAIQHWDNALRVLEWLRGLPDAVNENQTLEALERDFALSVNLMQESAAAMPRKMAPQELEERVTTARSIQQYMHALPNSIQAKLPAGALTVKRTATESVARRRKTVSVLLPVVGVVLLLGAVSAVAGPAIITELNKTPTPTIAPTATPMISNFFVPKTLAEWGEIPDCNFRESPLETGGEGFPICNSKTGPTYFRDYYSDQNVQLFLGPPISAEFQDRSVTGARLVQYFEKGRLEQFYDSTGKPIAGYGLIGYDLVRRLAQRNDGFGADEDPNLGSGWKGVENFEYLIRPEHGFLKRYTTTFGGTNISENVWNPYYGGPVSKEYKVSGQEVYRQFFERAIFQWRAGDTAEFPDRLPLGVLYANYVRNLNLPIPESYASMLNPAIDVGPESDGDAVPGTTSTATVP